jgi:hypothetical protein
MMIGSGAAHLAAVITSASTYSATIFAEALLQYSRPTAMSLRRTHHLGRGISPKVLCHSRIEACSVPRDENWFPGRTIRRGKFCSSTPGFDRDSLRRPLREGEIKQIKDFLSVLNTAPFLVDFTMRLHQNRFCHCLEHRWRQTMVVSSTTHLFPRCLSCNTRLLIDHLLLKQLTIPLKIKTRTPQRDVQDTDPKPCLWPSN